MVYYKTLLLLLFIHSFNTFFIYFTKQNISKYEPPANTYLSYCGFKSFINQDYSQVKEGKWSCSD